MVGGDVRKFYRDHISDTNNPERGILELGSFAKSKDIVRDGRAGLADLCEAVLGKRLPKPPEIRISDWEVPQLSDDQQRYAALDAFVSLEIYQRICSNESCVNNSRKLAANELMASTKVSYKYGNRIIFSGVVRRLDDFMRDVDSETVSKITSRLTKTRVLLEVNEVFVPNFKIRFPIYNDVETVGDLMSLGGDYPKLFIGGTSCLWGRSESSVDRSLNLVEGFSASNSETPISPQIELEINSKRKYSGVKQDAWHFMDRLTDTLPKHHGWFAKFIRAFRDAIFIHDKYDQEAVIKVLSGKGKDFDEVYFQKPDYILERVRRTIPSPIILHNRIKAVFDQYRKKIDDKTGKELFNENSEVVVKSLLRSALDGFLSDPVGISFYSEIGKCNFMI